jgi:hypothetical protein
MLRNVPISVETLSTAPVFVGVQIVPPCPFELEDIFVVAPFEIVTL